MLKPIRIALAKCQIAKQWLQIFGLLITISASLPSYAREPISEEGTLISKWDFPDGIPFWNRKKLNKSD